MQDKPEDLNDDSILTMTVPAAAARGELPTVN